MFVMFHDNEKKVGWVGGCLPIREWIRGYIKFLEMKRREKMGREGRINQ